MVPIPKNISDDDLRFWAGLPQWRLSEALIFCCLWRMENGLYAAGDEMAIRLCEEILQRAGCVHSIPSDDGLYVTPSEATNALQRAGWRVPDMLMKLSDTSPASDTGKAGATANTVKAGGLNIADTIGATAWGEIRLVIRPGDDTDAGGLTFHCGKKNKPYSWKDMGLHKADELRGALMLLAREGLIDRGKYLDTKRRDFDARRAREQAAGKMRGRVNKLNAKFLKHFPAVWGNPFFNDDGVTKHHFQKIEIQAMPDIAGVKQGKKYIH